MQTPSTDSSALIQALLTIYLRSLTLIEYIPLPPKEPVNPPAPFQTTRDIEIPELGPTELNEVGRHMQSLWTTAVTHIEGDSYLVGDHRGNLVVCNPFIDTPLFNSCILLRIRNAPMFWFS